MKVILLKDVKNVGKKDQVCEVSEGYGANYLIKNKLAVLYTNKSKNVLDSQISKRAQDAADEKAKAQEVAKALESITLEFTATASKDGRMMGTISPKQICEEMKRLHGIDIDKRRFVDKYPCNAFGYTRLKVELYKGVIGTVNVHVSPK